MDGDRPPPVQLSEFRDARFRGGVLLVIKTHMRLQIGGHALADPFCFFGVDAAIDPKDRYCPAVIENALSSIDVLTTKPDERFVIMAL